MENNKPDIPNPTTDNVTPFWGLRRAITPCLGARLVQQGNSLHFLGDRASVVGIFRPEATQSLEAAFSVLLTKLETQLLTGALDPRRQQSVTVQHAGFTCEADTLGSYGHVYIAVYQTIPPLTEA